MPAARCPDCGESSAPRRWNKDRTKLIGPETIIHKLNCPMFLSMSLLSDARALEDWAATSPPSPQALLLMAGNLRTHASRLFPEDEQYEDAEDD